MEFIEMDLSERPWFGLKIIFDYYSGGVLHKLERNPQYGYCKYYTDQGTIDVNLGGLFFEEGGKVRILETNGQELEEGHPDYETVKAMWMSIHGVEDAIVPGFLAGDVAVYESD